MFHDLQRLEVLIGHVVKLVKLLSIAIYQRRDIKDGMDMSLVDQAWPVVTLSETGYSLAVVYNQPSVLALV